MSPTLGVSPLEMSLVLVKNADFVCTLVSNAGDWPNTMSLSIQVGGSTWSATITGPNATFNVDKALVNAVFDESPRQFQLVYTEGATDLIWGFGPVKLVRTGA